MEKIRLYAEQLEWLLSTVKDEWKKNIIFEVYDLFVNGEVETVDNVRFNELRLIECFDLIFTYAKEGILDELEEGKK